MRRRPIRSGPGPARAERLRPALRGRRARLLAAALALVLTAGAAAGEFTARQLIRSRIARAAPVLGDTLTIRTGDGSALWDLANRRIPRLDVSSEDARLGPLPQAAVRARLDDVRLGGTTAVARTHAEVTVPARSLGTAVRTAAGSMPVGQVRTDPAAGTVEVALGQGGFGRLTLRPVIADGKVSLTVSNLTVLGRSVPPDDLGKAVPGPADGRPYPLGLRAGSVQVLPDGLRVVLDGGPGTLSGPDGGWTPAPDPGATP
ncbi:DUF2993 domain-containing protein [Streptomyces sp. CB03911]|uniref:LmeA family phospholipid-binding protein n=1 Tax=Streptomyces sp. CB03911 TaxID=1804758 RepID=UPI00093D2FEF|nr:DUF2993 domain-containing protein [Streptomyces sp. CB03911]OKI17497.1 hypothetical protein A6A07_40010 [Streptomyces sp. CB03911]